MQRYEINGTEVHDIPSLCAAFARAVDGPDGYFGSDLQSFDDCLFGGYGLEAPCEIVWRDHEQSRNAMGCDAMAEWCRSQSPSSREGLEWVDARRVRAEAGEYSLFDLIVETITSVEQRSSRNVRLRLTLA
ncbi:MAG: barstar family protein [Myxococcales bacterium]|nr:barstar family protein [Myxococcales bacterium]